MGDLRAKIDVKAKDIEEVRSEVAAQRMLLEQDAKLRQVRQLFMILTSRVSKQHLVIFRLSCRIRQSIADEERARLNKENQEKMERALSDER